MKNSRRITRDLLILLFLSDAAALILFFRFQNYDVAIILALILGLLLGVFIASELYFKPKLNSVLKNLSSLRNKKETEIKNDKKEIFTKINGQIDGLVDDRKQENELTRKLENYRKEYLGYVSHELKTPIFNIQGYVHTLIDGGLKDESVNLKYLNRASKSVERLIAIVQDLETISQFETGELELEHEKFDVVEVVKDVLDAQELKASQKKIVLSLKNQSAGSLFVYADKLRIRQVISNLVSNSIRYGKEDGETKVKLSDTGGKVLIEVADNGIGIPENQQHRIFERFFRIDKSRSREQGGTGLGLAIVKHIVEAHKQNINVLSTEGAGSVFSFFLNKQ